MSKKEKDVNATYGLARRTYPRSRQWAVDIDYAHKLSDADKLYLSRFLDFYYGADFRGPNDWSLDDRRAAYRSKNAANRDLYTRVDGPVFFDDLEGPLGSEFVADDPERDLGPTPEYLDSPAYKAARERFRATLSENVRPTTPKDTPQFQKTRERLRKIVRKGLNEPKE